MSFSTMAVTQSTALIHPRLVQVSPPQQNIATRDELPRLLPLTAQSLSSEGAFLVEDGSLITLWLGRGVHTDFLQQTFGWPSLEGVDATGLSSCVRFRVRVGE